MTLGFTSRKKAQLFPLILLYCFSLLAVTAMGQTQAATTSRQTGVNSEYQVGAILWTQSSAEYRALAYQTFSLATLQLDQVLRQKHPPSKKRAAVIVDVDETVLDNSRFQAELVLRGLPYSSEIGRRGVIALKPTPCPELSIF